jgi:uncharacterized protein YbcV (DUF1398 family)
MFTLTQIQEAHKKVKSGADFPAYAKEIHTFGVTGYDTFVSDGHALYFGNRESLVSPPKYDALEVADIPNREYFIERLRLHQSGGTDYTTFCQDCAECGVEKWTLDLEAGTCTYFDTHGDTLILENFPIS